MNKMEEYKLAIMNGKITLDEFILLTSGSDRTEQRQCYQGCKQHNPHYAELCDELNYHQDCPTYKYNQGE